VYALFWLRRYAIAVENWQHLSINFHCYKITVGNVLVLENPEAQHRMVFIWSSDDDLFFI
jgi:hypothetical protein